VNPAQQLARAERLLSELGEKPSEAGSVETEEICFHRLIYLA
jgi:hypothetical protein